MDEIRFSHQPPQEQEKQASPKSRSFVLKKVLKSLGLALIIVLIITAAFLGKDLLGGVSENNDAYSAIFLVNGQVYFGKIIKNNNQEIVLNNVYYLQVNESGGSGVSALGQASFNLVKLGQELHGPTDKLYINKTQIIFYEYLRDDSKVVESIRTRNQ